jgi:hypothetical protein
MAPVLDELVLESMSLTLMLITIIVPFGGSVFVEPILTSSPSMAVSWVQSKSKIGVLSMQLSHESCNGFRVQNSYSHDFWWQYQSHPDCNIC